MDIDVARIVMDVGDPVVMIREERTVLIDSKYYSEVAALGIAS